MVYTLQYDWWCSASSEENNGDLLQNYKICSSLQRLGQNHRWAVLEWLILNFQFNMTSWLSRTHPVSLCSVKIFQAIWWSDTEQNHGSVWQRNGMWGWNLYALLFRLLTSWQRNGMWGWNLYVLLFRLLTSWQIVCEVETCMPCFSGCLLTSSTFKFAIDW